MRFSIIAGFAALAVASVASPAEHTYVSHEKRDAKPKHWVKRSRVDPSHLLPMRIGLTQSNIEHGEQILMEISDPESPKYGQHYTEEQIHDLFAPAKEAVNATIEWLRSSGISPERIGQSVNKQWLQFEAAAEEAERLFKTKYHHWKHNPTGKEHIACEEYHIPHGLKPHIDYISPGVKLMAGGKVHQELSESKKSKREISKRDLLKKKKKTAAAPVGPGPILGPIVHLEKGLTSKFFLKHCDTLITPECVKALYNITAPTKAHPSNKMGIFEEGDFYALEDLVEFFALLAPQIPALTEPILHGVDGGHAPGTVATGESDLDFQLAYPIIYPQQAVLFQTDDFYNARGLTNSTGFLNTFLDAIDGSYCTFEAFGEKGDSPIDPKYPDKQLIGGFKGKNQCGVYKPTNVISISYGEQEDDLPTNYQRRQCLEFMKLGMRGVSVIIASGDAGVAARSVDDGNSDGCLGKNGTVFNPDFPASCPFVTALGATFLPPGGNVFKDEEVATTSFPSGGGFSNIYERPSYQDKAIGNYFAKHDPGYSHYSVKHTNNPSDTITQGRRYNRIGRGYPDAAAIGDNVVVVVDGLPTLVGGTSAATPVFGAIINRINEERLSAGKKPVGFVNPTLYKHTGMFHDITTGSNPGCGTGGFSCAPGWDPVTGLGTPNYPAMLKVFMSLP